MVGRLRISRWLVAAVLIAAVAALSLAALQVVTASPAQAQGFFDLFRPMFPDRRYERRRAPRHQRAPRARSAPRAEPARAPPPPNREAAAATTIVVMGDRMADWLAWGLEEAFSESPDVAIVRENEHGSGLIRFDGKDDRDWARHAREVLGKQKADYVVMMLGIHDRQNIREQDVIAQAEYEAEERRRQAEAAVQRALANAPGGAPAGEAGEPDGAEDPGRKKPAAAAPPTRKRSSAIFEFRSGRWEEVYARRIDRTIAALRSKGVPVLWVGLPSIRGTRSTSDAAYLNEMFRARAERAGIVYVDVWDGFVAESGRYTSHGPDYQGQPRRLRSSDGVFFTRHGARKLAHYVEREIRRLMDNRAAPVALPSGPLGPLPGGQEGARPVAGPVIPLTVPPAAGQPLAGAPGRRRVYGDPVAADTLIRGEPLDAPPGRADDFSWPPEGEADTPPATTGAPAPAGAATSGAGAQPPTLVR